MNPLIKYFHDTVEKNNYKRGKSQVWYAICCTDDGVFYSEEILLPEDKNDIGHYYQFGLKKPLNTLLGFLTKEEFEHFKENE